MEQQSPNERRLEDWMRTYGTAILRTCFVILSDAREAEDAMQDTFLRAWRAMDTFEQRNGASVKTWLMRIAINVCRDYQRKRWFRHIDMRLKGGQSMEQQSPNERRLEDWMRTYGTAILRTCFVILSDAREAEDAMQDTFLRAWRAMDTFEQRNGASVKTWLMRIAINVCRDYQRKRWFRHIDMRHALEDLPQGMMTVLPEDRELMLDILRLPDDLKNPLILYYYQDMNLQETADALGISKSTVHTRLKKAEQALKLSLTGGDCYV